MERKIKISTVIILLVYFVFTSGMVFHLAASDTVEYIDVPYSIAFDKDEHAIVGMYTDNDIKCAEWIVENKMISAPIMGDYNGVALLLEMTKAINLTANPPVKGKYYVFMTEWNTENEKWIIGANPGARRYQELPEVETLVHSEGNAKVYKVSSGYNLSSIAVLFMDVWRDIPIEYWEGVENEESWTNWWNGELTNHVKDKLIPFYEFIKDSGITIVCTDGDNRGLISELDGEIVINDPQELDKYLFSKGINTIIYVGYATNMCVLDRATGMRGMDALGYNVYLMPEFSLAVPDHYYTLGDALNEIENNFGGLMTMDKFEELINED